MCVFVCVCVNRIDSAQSRHLLVSSCGESIEFGLLFRVYGVG